MKKENVFINLIKFRDDIIRIVGLHGGHNVRVFGSVARNTATADSDLDLLIDLEPKRSLLDIIAIKQDIEDLIGRAVDVVTERALSKYLRDQILKEAVEL